MIDKRGENNISKGNFTSRTNGTEWNYFAGYFMIIFIF